MSGGRWVKRYVKEREHWCDPPSLLGWRQHLKPAVGAQWRCRCGQLWEYQDDGRGITRWREILDTVETL